MNSGLLKDGLEYGGDKQIELQNLFMQIVGDLRLNGRIEAFGSYRSGFTTGSSDLDLVYVPTEEEKTAFLGDELTPITILQRFAIDLQQKNFRNIVSVFQASMPLLKAVGPSGTDVDLCVGNELGLHNSKLMARYAELDARVIQVGQCVKHWAKYCDLTCSSDGHLNSYGYTLLTIFYLMHTDPPVLPNLQDLAAKVDNTPNWVADQRWGCKDQWDCQFFSDISLIPKRPNKLGVGELIAGFFHFYVNVFDWQNHAVSIRLARTLGDDIGHPLKEGLLSTQGSNAWYIEDPFDLKHNLAALSTARARQRIIDKMREMLAAMHAPGQDPMDVLIRECPQEGHNSHCFLKCRVHLEKVSRDDFVNYFRACPVLKIYWPQQAGFQGRTETFLEFANEVDRRQTHTLNEEYVSGWQLRLLTCSVHALEDARSESGIIFDEIEGPGAATEESLPTNQYDQIVSGLRNADNAEEKKVFLQRAKALGIGLHGEEDRHLESLGKGGSGKQHWGYDPSGPEDYDEGGDTKAQRWRRAKDKRRADSDGYGQNSGKSSMAVKGSKTGGKHKGSGKNVDKGSGVTFQ